MSEDELEQVTLDEEDMHGYVTLFRGLVVAVVLVVFLVVVGVVALIVWGSK